MYYRNCNYKNADWTAWVRIYSTNFPPTAAEVGAVPTSGGIFTGDVTFNRWLYINAWPGYGEGKGGLWYDANKTSLLPGGGVTDIGLNAKSATVLKTPRKINGVPFDGSQDITIDVSTAGTASKLAHTLTFTNGSTATFDGSQNVSVSIPKIASDVGAVPSTGGEFTGDVIVDKFFKIRAWPEYGEGTCNFWYDGNKKLLCVQTATDINLNAKSATTASSADKVNHRLRIALTGSVAVAYEYDGSADTDISINIPTKPSTAGIADKVAHALTINQSTTSNVAPWPMQYDGSDDTNITIYQYGAYQDSGIEMVGNFFKLTKDAYISTLEHANFTVVWKNETPSSDFASQTIDVGGSLNQFKYIIIICSSGYYNTKTDASFDQGIIRVLIPSISKKLRISDCLCEGSRKWYNEDANVEDFTLQNTNGYREFTISGTNLTISPYYYSIVGLTFRISMNNRSILTVPGVVGGRSGMATQDSSTYIKPYAIIGFREIPIIINPGYSMSGGSTNKGYISIIS